MRCDRCYRLLEHGEHGLGLCPLEPRRYALALRQDTIEGGIAIAHGICNEDGTPKTYYSRSEIRQACAVKEMVPWTDVYTEDRTKDAHVHNDWLQSGEAQRARRDRVEARNEKYLKRDREAARR